MSKLANAGRPIFPPGYIFCMHMFIEIVTGNEIKYQFLFDTIIIIYWGNYVYGAKMSRWELTNLPHTIAALMGGCVLFQCVYMQSIHFLWIGIAAVLVNMAYNLHPLRLSGRGPFELPTVCCGFAIVTIFSCFWNELPFPPMRYWLHMVFLVLRTQLWTEFMDYEEDAKHNRKTTSVLIGRTASQIVVAAVLLGEAIMVLVFFICLPSHVALQNPEKTA